MDWKLELIVVPVSDVDRAKAFYAEQLGFNVDVDHRPNENFRVVQLTPPGSACSVSIGIGVSGGMSPGCVKGLHLIVTDIEAAHAMLTASGVNVNGPVHFDEGRQVPGPHPNRGDYESFLFFEDPKGHERLRLEQVLDRLAGDGMRVERPFETGDQLMHALIEAGALVRTPDGGRTWEDGAPNGPYDTHTAATHRLAPDRVYSAAGDGYFESRDAGRKWARHMEGLRHRYLVGIAVDQEDPDTVIVSCADGPWSAYDPPHAESYVYRRSAEKAWHVAMEGLPGAAGTSKRSTVPLEGKKSCAGSSALSRASIAQPRGTSSACVKRTRSPPANSNVTPAASCSWAST